MSWIDRSISDENSLRYYVGNMVFDNYWEAIRFAEENDTHPLPGMNASEYKEKRITATDEYLDRIGA